MLPEADPSGGSSALIWPSSSGRLTVDPAVLSQVARAMEGDLHALKSALDTVQSGGLVTSIDTGMSGAASGLGDATGNAFAGISQYMSDLITAQQAVLDRINQSAAAYTDTEANNVALVNSVGTGSVPSGMSGGTATGTGSPGGGTVAAAGPGGSLGTGSGGSLAGFTPPPSGGVGTLPAPVAPGPAGPIPSGVPASPISPIAPFPVVSGVGRGGLPGEPDAGPSVADEPVPGEFVPGEPVPGEPVDPMPVGEPVIGVVGEPVVGEPVVGEPVVGEPVVGEPVIGGRGVAMVGGGGPPEVESEALGERSLANSLGIIGDEESPMLAESPAVNGVVGIGAAEDGAATGETGGFMPVVSAGGDRDREHTTWLTEDSDVWSGKDDVAPPVIGDTRR